MSYESRYFIWPAESNLEVFKHGRNYFDSDNGITVLERAETYWEFFFFSGSRKNKWLANLYLNNLDVLENFICYFKEKLYDILKEAENSRILIPQQHYRSIVEEVEIVSLFEEEVSGLKQKLFIKSGESLDQSPFKREVFALLSTREVDIVTCLLNGSTAKETARKLFISHRTVERHLENIKIKLSCKTKFELVNKLLNASSVEI
jgi:DNA-binding CsgD family transcriptional regulator